MFPEIESLIQKSDFLKALNQINSISPSSAPEQIHLDILKADINNRMGKKENTKKIIDQLDQKQTICEIPILFLKFQNLKINFLSRNNQLTESSRLIEESKNFIQSLQIDSDPELHKEVGDLFKLEGLNYFYAGKLEKCLPIFEKSLKIFQLYQDEYNSNVVLNAISLVYWNSGRLKRALEYQKQIIERLESLLLENTQNYSNSCNNIGILYNALGVYPKGLFYHQKSLELRKKLSLKADIPTALINIGLTYFHMADYESSLKYLTEGYELEKQFNNYFLISGALFELIRVHLFMKNYEAVERYFTALESILSDHKDDLRVDYRVKMSRALMLFDKKRLKDKIKAQELFEEILKLQIPTYELNILTIEKLLDILFMEFKSTEEQEVLDEIKSLIAKMSTIAEGQRSFSLFIQVLILNAKLSIFEGNIQKAKKTLEKALTEALNKNLGQLARDIEVEIQKLTDLINKWIDLATKGSTVLKYNEDKITSSYQFNLPKVHSIELEDDEIKNFTSLLEELHSISK